LNSASTDEDSFCEEEKPLQKKVLPLNELLCYLTNGAPEFLDCKNDV
jgi:hypothetical protein